MKSHTIPSARSLATLVCTLGLAMSAQADVVELAKYTFDGRPYSRVSTAAPDADWTAGAIVTNTLGSLPYANVLTFISTVATSETAVVSNDRYFQFTVTPSSDQALDLAQLSFQASGNSLGGGYAVYYSLGTSDFTRIAGDRTFRVQSIANLSSGADTIDLAAEGATFQDLASPVTFRFFAWQNTASSTKGYFDNIVLSGSQSVSAVPEPETYAMLVAGLGVLGMMQRRRGQASAAASRRVT